MSVRVKKSQGTISAIGYLIAILLLFPSANGRCQPLNSSPRADDLWCVYPDGEGLGKGRHIVLISGDEEYRSEEALPMLGKILSQRHGFKCTVLFAINPVDGTINPKEQTNIPGMEAIASADLVVLSLRFRCLPDEQMKFFADYLEAGKPIIGLRTSTHAFNYPADSKSPFAHFGHDGGKWPGGFGKHVLGETWVSHHGHHKVESTRGVTNDVQKEHPILRGVDDVWGPTDVYGINKLPAGSNVMLYGQVLQGMQPSDAPVVGMKNEPMMPLAWIRDFETESGKSARIFCTTMGASQDFTSEGLRRLVVNAAYWCLGMEDKIPDRTNVEIVGEYAPIQFGFDAFQPGKRPADYDLPKNGTSQSDNAMSEHFVDARLGPLRTLDSHFPFEPPKTAAQWRERAALVREQIAVALGLYPLPTRTPLNAMIHGRQEFEDYSIEKVYFESLPGFYVTGSLYRPLRSDRPCPAVLSPHGHWNNGRFYDAGSEAAAKELASGAETDLETARVPLQARCVHLTRMGCVVFFYDMIGYADNTQITQELAHGFALQRPEMNSATRWGLFSPQAESHLQSVMGLQTWNSIRALDFLESLPYVDHSRIAVTGASGGGTQTMILAALDPRPCAIFPAVMVSTAMQGGCTCENASLLRIGTGNVEFAALFAPKPQGLSTANDWTKDMSRDGFPQLQSLYRLLGKPENIRLCDHTEFGHNYNAVSRAAMYELFNDALQLNADTHERPFTRQTPEQLTVWDDQHRKPVGGDDFERRLLEFLAADSQSQVLPLLAREKFDLTRWKEFLRPAYRSIFGRTAETESVRWQSQENESIDGLSLEQGAFENSRRVEHAPAVVVKPTQKWNGRYVICVSAKGKSILRDEQGKLSTDVKLLTKAGFGVIGLDLFWQGGSLPRGADRNLARLVENKREAAGYTFGYNDPTFVRRVHDVLNVVSELSTNPDVKIDLLAVDGLGQIAVAVRALAGSAVSRAAIDTQGFRFATITDLRDVNFLPGGAKYGDLPAMLAIAARSPLWLRGEKPAETQWIEDFDAVEGERHWLHPATDADNPIDWLISDSGRDR